MCLVRYIPVALPVATRQAVMPQRAISRRVRAERELRERVELDVVVLQRELDRRAMERPPLARPATAQWDWRCACSNIVWAGRKHCPMCYATRNQGGYTITGSVRGVFQSTSNTVAARDAQRLVPGYGLQHSCPDRHKRPVQLHGGVEKGVGGNTTPVQRPASFLEAARRATYDHNAPTGIEIDQEDQN